MNILIIGNGFDLAHDLPTKYTDFLKFVECFKQYKDICKQEYLKEHYENATEEDKEFLIFFGNLYQKKPKIFEEIYTLIDKNLWIDHFWKLYLERKLPEKDGWVDFEAEISRIIQNLDKTRHTILEQINEGKDNALMSQKQFITLNSFFQQSYQNRNEFLVQKDYIEHRKKQILNDLNNLTRCLEIYLCEYVENMATIYRLPDIKKLDITHVLSFNYTHTFSKLYDNTDLNKIKYDYVHGEVKENSNINDCNLILGIDEYLDGTDKDNDNEFIQFKKFFQRIYKKTGCNHVEWKEVIDSMPKGYGLNNKTIHNIYIIGHSLSETDKDILKLLINMDKTKTTIFYHDQETLGNYISNLVKILTEEELIKRVHGKNATIILQKQQSSILIE